MSQFRPVNFNQASVRANELVANTKLGIGTHSQTSELHIKAAAPELQIEGASATMKVVASGTETTFRSDQDVKWTSADAGTVHMTLDGTSGYVGVGTTIPQEKFHVYGSPMIQHNQVYLTTTNNSWYKVGTWKAYSGDTEKGGSLKLSFLGGYLYGSQPMGESVIYARIGNNSSSRFISWKREGEVIFNDVRMQRVGSENFEYDICVKMLHYSRHTIKVECSLTDSFTKKFDSITEPSLADTTNVTGAVLLGSTDIAGKVGIGLTNPSYPLHVTGSAGNMPAMKYFNSGSTNIASGANDTITIYAAGNIYASGLVAASDERIKKNIVDADDVECLETLRLLKPKKYQYKDEINRGQQPVWGFIAQEVRDTLQYATHLGTNVVPNMYEVANVSQSNVITFTNFNTSNLEANATTIQAMTTDGKEEKVTIAEVIDEHTIRLEEDLTDWTGSVDETGNVVAGNQLFIYGQEVDDFVFIKKEAIWTIATAALQEVDRQLQETKAQLASVLTRLDALENP